MKHLALTFSIIALLTTSAVCQLQRGGEAWDGYVQRGKVKVRAGGSTWSVNGTPVSHTEERYETHDMALYILGRLKGKVHPASELAPNAGSLQFKVTPRKGGTRIAWVCENDLHYVDANSYATAVAFLGLWGFDHC